MHPWLGRDQPGTSLSGKLHGAVNGDLIAKKLINHLHLGEVAGKAAPCPKCGGLGQLYRHS